MVRVVDNEIKVGDPGRSRVDNKWCGDVDSAASSSESMWAMLRAPGGNDSSVTIELLPSDSDGSAMDLLCPHTGTRGGDT